MHGSMPMCVFFFLRSFKRSKFARSSVSAAPALSDVSMWLAALNLIALLLAGPAPVCMRHPCRSRRLLDLTVPRLSYVLEPPRCIAPQWHHLMGFAVLDWTTTEAATLPRG